MRPILAVSIVLLMFASALTAQRAPGGNANPAPSNDRQRSTAPASSPRTSERSSTTITPRAQTVVPRNSTTTTTTDRSTSASGSTQNKKNTPNSTSQQPAQSLQNRQLQNSGSGLTARSAGTTGSLKAPSLKKSPEAGKVNWMTLEQAVERNKTEKRKIFIDVMTDWCGWCKRMDSTTFVNPAVANYLNEHYYPVKFNAEQQQDIVFNGKTYHFKRNGLRGYHELAAEWLNNRLSFPTTVFLDENQTLIQPLPGYQDATKMEAIINYFGGDNHKKTPWESYERNFGVGQ
jgi:thioredoxin-related protein